MHFGLDATLRTAVGAQPLRLRRARGLWARFSGLMLRRELGREPPHGLLIPHCPSVHGFFMRYPLDVVYLAGDGAPGRYRVTHTAHLRPWGLSFGRSHRVRTEAGWVARRSQHALELPAGTVARHGIEPGQLLEVHAP